MSAYRETLAALRLRIAALETELAQRNDELTLRLTELSERDARLERLRRAVEDIGPTKQHRTRSVAGLFGAGALILTAVVAMVVRLHSTSSSEVAGSAPETAREPTRAPRVRIPTSLAVVIDSRLSMQPHLAPAALAIVKLVNTLEDDDRIGILQVDGRGSQVVLPVSTAISSRAALAGVLARVSVRAPEWPAKEQFTVSSGITAAMELLERWTPDARIVVVTDGEDASWAYAEGTAAHAADRGFRVSALGAGRFTVGYPESIARAGHGSFASLSDQASLDRFITEQRD